jgi:hypothetical protein
MKVSGVVLLAALLGCAHAPTPSPQVKAAETRRLDRLPDDERTLDGTWDDVRVRVSQAGGRTQATLEVRHPKLRFFYRPEPAGAADRGKPAATDKPEPTAKGPSKSVPEALRRMAPFDVDRIEIHAGELVFVDMSKPAKPELWLSNLEVSIENVASRPGMAEWRPVLLTASAKVQHSGDLALFVTADPWSEDLNFSGRASVERLATKELYGFLADSAKLQLPNGALDLFVAFTAKDAKVVGGVKAILQNPDVRPVEGGVLARMKAWAVERVLSLTSDRVKGRNAVATVLPISGELAAPRAELWPAIAGVLYNAYVTGVAAGFGGVPASASTAQQSGKNQSGSAEPTPPRPLTAVETRQPGPVDR